MKQKAKHFFKGIIKNNYKLIILYIILILLVTIKFDYQIYSPGSLINLDKKIEIDNSYKSEGSFNLTFVSGRPATILFILGSYIIPSWDLVPLSDMQIENESEEEVRQRNKIFLNNVNDSAVIVAFNELGIGYEIENQGVSVLHVYESSNTNLKTGDIIKSIDNIKTDDINDFVDILDALTINQKINLKVLRDAKEIDTYAYIKEDDGKKIIGISITNEYKLISDTNIKFKFKKNETGPSGGLMTSLKIYDMLTEEDITKGRVIAGTGTISEDGVVGEISGIKYKLAGAAKKKADIFLCPTGNYQECIKEVEKNNYNIKIIEADIFNHVLTKLKNEP